VSRAGGKPWEIIVGILAETANPKKGSVRAGIRGEDEERE